MADKIDFKDIKDKSQSILSYANIKEVNDDEMSIIAWGNRSDVIDRSKEIIDDNAWNLESFLKNPVIPAFHDYSRPPIGKAMWVKVVKGQGLRFKLKFANTDEGKEFYQLYKDGILNAFSVGFRVHDLKYIEDFDEKDIEKYTRDGKLPTWVFTDVELYEISAVVVPDNQDSLVERAVNGEIKAKALTEYIKTTFTETKEEVKEEDVVEEKEEIIVEEKDTKDEPEVKEDFASLDKIIEDELFYNSMDIISNSFKYDIKRTSDIFSNIAQTKETTNEFYPFETKIFDKYFNNSVAITPFIPKNICGIYLHGFDSTLKGVEEIGSFNFSSDGFKIPVKMEDVYFNKDESRKFITDGIVFYKLGDKNFAVKYAKKESGIFVCLICNKENINIIDDIYMNSMAIGDENNPILALEISDEDLFYASFICCDKSFKDTLKYIDDVNEWLKSDEKKPEKLFSIEKKIEKVFNVEKKVNVEVEKSLNNDNSIGNDEILSLMKEMFKEIKSEIKSTDVLIEERIKKAKGIIF